MMGFTRSTSTAIVIGLVVIAATLGPMPAQTQSPQIGS